MVFRFSGKNKPIVTGLLCSVALLVALSGCSSGSQESATKSQTGASAEPAQEIKVDMGDFFYTPSDITVKSGKVRFVLTNVGATAHRFSIKTGDTVTWTSKNVGAGRESILEVELPPGSYNLGCTLGDHEARGAKGKLTVQ
ncbi:MAG: cupredoxin domain-containing protein [Dehalococcoidales bacterium]|nr:cupredoxin domain-containing protein [Dehalococcoidales bacterium]